MEIVVSLADAVAEAEVLALYRAHRWSAAEKPGQLMAALRNSHALVTARVAGRLVGLANAISDGHLVVYFPHLLVHPDFQRRGVGRRMMTCLLDQYRDFHQRILVADGAAVSFYAALGLSRAGRTESMWIYAGGEH